MQREQNAARGAVRAASVNSTDQFSLPRGWILTAILLMVGILLAIGTVRQAAGAGTSPENAVAMLVPPGTGEGGTIGAESCARCHEMSSTFSHPTGVFPTMEVPSGLPLDNGKVSCITCHQNTFAAHETAREKHEPMLRGTAETMCGQCHAPNEITRGKQHPTAISRAHLPGARKGVAADKLSFTFADTSRSCLGCHDGTVASDGFPRGGVGSTGMLGKGNHPIDVAYPDQVRRGDRGMVSKANLDARIHLPNGQVSCTSCHSLYSSEKKLLVMNNTGSALCTSCHSMR